MESGTLVKVLQTFFTMEKDELSLNKGDFFLIHKVIDKHWCYGQSHNQFGKFPLNYLHKIKIPEINKNESLFISIAAFKGEKPGELSFNKGEIIIGNVEPSSNWINGYIGSRKGVFSSSYIWQLDLSLIQKTIKKKVIKRNAKVNMNLKAQLDEEIDLIKGEIITVTEVFDDGWCRGYKENGNEGTFPESFITYQENINIDEEDKSSLLFDDTFSVSFVPSKIYTDFDKNNSNKVNIPYDDVLPNYGLCPDKTVSNIQVSSGYDSFRFKSLIVAQFPFTAEYPNELSFKAGQIIELIKYIDNEWAEGMIDNVRGIFPLSFVKLHYVESNFDAMQSNSPVIQNNLQSTDQNDVNTSESRESTKVELSNDWTSIINDHKKSSIFSNNYSHLDFDPNKKVFQDELKHLVIIRNKKKNFIENEIEQSKKLFEPCYAALATPISEKMSLEIQRNQVNPIEEETDIFSSMKKKRFEKRQKVITELYETEKDYVRDLKMTYETFNLHDPSFLKSKGIDIATLFGNISEIINIAGEFIELIKVMKHCDEESQCIGSCFLKISEKMRIAYGKYCSNHELSLALLQKYEDKEDIMKIFNKGVETLRRQVACFGMNSILIKPVQRILKYSLFLTELLKFTEDNHPDKSKILEASKVMANVARYINEYKKKKEVAFKYLHYNNTFKGKIANLNMHSVAKKSSRLGAKLSATLGLTNLPTDSKFDELVKDFISLEKSTKQFLKDVVQCILYLDDESQCGEVLTILLHRYFTRVPNDEILKLQKIRNTVRSQFIEDLKTCIDIRVLSPLNTLITLLAGPELLINKRHDKMLDYDTAISKNEKSKEKGIISEDLSNAKSNFEALNQQLLEELPIFIQAATAILYNCIGAFTTVRKFYNEKIMNEYLNISKCMNQVSIKDILENFLVNHNLLYHQMIRFTYDNTNIGFDKESVDYCFQSDIHKVALRMKYPHNKLYMVTETIFGATQHDLSVIKGTIVGVIKTQNPMGDTSKWFVDNGSVKGFLDRRYLEIFNEAKFIQENQSLACANNSVDLISLDSPKSEVTKYSTNFQTLYTIFCEERNKLKSSTNINTKPRQLYENICEFVHALYDFNDTQISGTLSIKKGQTLKVLKKHDNKNNSDYWLVEDRNGGKGLVPYNLIQSKET